MYGDRFGHGGVGIVAANIGRFRLSEFRISSETVEKDKKPAIDSDDNAREEVDCFALSMLSNCADGMEFQELRDPRSPDNLYISGPDVSVYSYAVGSFVWGKTPSANQSARQQNARQVFEPVAIMQYLTQQILPMMKRDGYI